MGTAVVNDATAAYHNPAALTLLKKSQMIALGSFATFKTHFTGQVFQSLTDTTQRGSSDNQVHYLLPSAYLGTPVTDNISLGLAIIYNSFNNELDGNSILRYSQSASLIKDIDFVPALGIKLNQFLSIGVGMNLSKANFLLKPRFNFADINIPDSQSRNETKGTSLSGDFGVLLKPAKSTLIGFNYRGANAYHQKGTSTLEGNPPLISNDYHFKFWTPARNILSINHFVTSKLGLISTIQYIQWNIIKKVTLYGAAIPGESKPVIVPKTVIPYNLHNSWLVTLGTHFRTTSKSIIRVAGTYNQSPESGRYQISTGDSIIMGGSMSYEFNKHTLLDLGYSHAFFKAADIRIASRARQVNGINKANRDAISLKLTITL